MRVANLFVRFLGLFHAISALSPRLRALKNRSERDNRRSLLFSVTRNAAQVYYVPLPEKELNADSFKAIARHAGGDPGPHQEIVSIISLSIGTDNTIVWYDHYEDGYEPDTIYPKQNTTEVWGDGDASNGCAPSTAPVKPCTNANDVLDAGRSIVLENNVFPYVEGQIKYGGGDKISASLPVTVTRGAYPDYPGSVLAGALEMMDTAWWGKKYETAISSGTTGQMDKNFEYVGYYIQAMEDNTIVTYPDETTDTLNEGETAYFTADETGKEFGADKKVQVHMLTGQKNSLYELRWFSVWPVEEYFSEYWCPVGDKGNGGIQVVVYNPHSTNLVISYEVLRGGKKNKFNEQTELCPPKGNCWSSVIPRNSGAKFFADKSFLAFAVIDTGDNADDGQVSDWGFPLIPASFLTPQVLIGWGYGCGGLDCTGGFEGANEASRSVVWVTVMEDASVWVDYENDGVVDKYNTKFYRLMSKTYKHDSDHDMSGAVIWATEMLSGQAGPPVLLAAAWGQDPNLSDSTDATQALDMGTVVMPMKGIDTFKAVELITDNPDDIGTGYADVISDGDTIEYVINVVNVGQIDYAAQELFIQDNLSEWVRYVPGSTIYTDSFSMTNVYIPDGVHPNPEFPLETGLNNLNKLEKRGGILQISFRVIIDLNDEIGPGIICNDGSVVGPHLSTEFSKCFILSVKPKEEWFSTDPSLGPTLEPTLDPSEDPTDSPTNEDEECPEDEVFLFL